MQCWRPAHRLSALPCQPNYDRAVALHASAPLVDGHNDLPWEFRARKHDVVMGADTLDLDTYLQGEVMTDFPRLTCVLQWLHVRGARLRNVTSWC